MSAQRVVHALAADRLLPVVTIDDPWLVADLCAALLAGGVSCIEITFRTDAAEAAIAAAAEVEGMLVGAGTLLSPGQARAAAAAGASFGVAPGTDDEVIETCAELGLPFFPGIATPSELGRALRLGCDVVKVFPAAQLGGPAFLRAVSAAFPQARFIPTGGVDGESLASYLDVPQVIACGGSWIVDRKLLAARSFAEVTRRARAAAAVPVG